MKVFLTGGTGFIGQPLTKALITRNWEVVALVRKPDSLQAQALLQMGAQCVQGDITNQETMRDGMTGADIVIHNAGWYEIGVNSAGKKLMYDINVTGTENVLSLAQELNIPRVVHISSIVAFGETGSQLRDETYERQLPYRSYYEQTKAEADIIARDYQQKGMPLTIVCPSAVVGPNDHSNWGYFLRLYLNKLMTPFSWSPDIKLTPVHVDDLAEGVALVVEKGQLGDTYLLAGESITLREILALWATRPGRFKVRFWVPRGLMSILFAPLEPLQRMVGLPAFLSREAASALRSANFSSKKAKDELGWTHRSAEEMWMSIIDEELKLLANRQRRDLVSRLKPVDK